MSLRLYYADSRLDRFTGVVVDIADDGRRVYLDRTAFYPTSGGQPHDLGTLGGVPVVDVIDEETRIAHCLAEPIGVPTGAMLVGQIDMVRRFAHMQQHTGQHLLSALLADEYGWPTLSVHFGDDSNTVDVDGVECDSEQLRQIERRVNGWVVQNRAVTVTYEDAAEAQGLRKASDREGELRIVSIDGFDRSACGGTHVDRTGEIGLILLRRAEKSKGHLRLEFVCGHRAVARASADHALLTRSARLFSAGAQELPELVEQQLSRMAEGERERKRMAVELARYEAATLWNGHEVDADGLRRIRMVVARPVKESEPLVQQLITLGGCVVLVKQTETGSILFAVASDTGLDAGQLLRASLQRVGGRGGGSPRMAQGAVADAAQVPLLEQFLGF